MPVAAPVITTVTATVGEIASAGTVTSVVIPVADGADELITSLPVIDSVLGQSPLRSILDPVTSGIDSVIDTTADLVTPRIDGLAEGADGLIVGSASLQEFLELDSIAGRVPASADQPSSIGIARTGILPASSATSGVPPLSSDVMIGDAAPAPVAPFGLASVGSSGAAATGSSGGHPSALAALASGFSFTLAVGIRSAFDAGARAFALSYDPGSSPD